MDDLLALLEQNPPEASQSQSKEGNTTRRSQNETKINERRTGKPASQYDSAPTNESPSNNEQTDTVTASVDGKVGIRMMNRTLSGMELLDVISSYPYHSTASLSAMSLAALNRLLIDPASVVDQATVCGKANFITVGIVFSNSGTRISSSGNAFCVLQLGTLQAGPSVSVVCFGSAYSKLTKYQPGTVIALVQPRLLPPSEGKSAVTFSVNDDRQLLVVAEARDFGICKATIRGKDADGQWRDGKRCSNHVDKRVSEYCAKHRKQERIVAGNAMQRLRAENSVLPSTQQKVLTQPSKLRHQKGMLRPSLQLQIGLQTAGIGSSSASLLRRGNDLPSNETSNPQRGLRHNSLLNPRTTSINHEPRLTGSRQAERTPRLSSKPVNKEFTSNTNPYISSSLSRGGSSSQKGPPASPLTMNSGESVKRQSKASPKDWLKQVHQRAPLTNHGASSKTNRKFRSINTDAVGFDGSVIVPKASKLFARKPAVQTCASSRLSSQINMSKHDDTKKTQVLEKQKLVAEQLQGNDRVVDTTKTRKALIQPQKKENAKHENLSNERIALFESFGHVDLDKIMATRSLFEDEANAEAYAASRNRVMDLEQKEESQAKNKMDAKSAIEKEWFCHTCNRSFKQNPSMCHRSLHKVKTRRKLKNSVTIDDRRSSLSEKAVEDGGLRLGQGLEWDRWSRFHN